MVGSNSRLTRREASEIPRARQPVSPVAHCDPDAGHRERPAGNVPTLAAPLVRREGTVEAHGELLDLSG